MNDDETTVPGMADAIERRRIELGMTPGEFADAAGLTRQVSTRCVRVAGRRIKTR
jgi:DNA-binding XRE family transcriptional regulator